MVKKEKEDFIQALKSLSKLRDITNDEIKGYLEQVFSKAFEKEPTHGNDEESIILDLANVESVINMDDGKISIFKVYEVVKEIDNPSEITHKILVSDPRIADQEYKIGDFYKEEINLDEISSGKMQYIKQLLIQKIREAEKLKLYEQFRDKKGKIVHAKVNKIEENYIILDYDNVSIFLPRSETSPLDKFSKGDIVKIYIIEVEKVSKDAQIIGSRVDKNFIIKLIEEEIDDVADGIIKVEKIVRIPGVKSKIVVSSNIDEVDPVGSIIGVRGKRIKPVVDELFGERIDVIKYFPEEKELITHAILPAKVEGVIEKLTDDGKKQYILIVTKDNFLPALGKRGANVKLVASLVNAKIDVKTIEDAKAEGLTWEQVVRTTHHKQQKHNKNILIDVEGYDLEDLEDMGDEYE